MTQITNSGVTIRTAVLAACSILTLVLPPTSGAQQSTPALSRVEQKIRDYVRSHETEQINLLEKAVNINSGTLNLAGVRAVGKLLEPEFAALGFDAKWIPLPDAVGRAGHLFAESKGKRGKRLLLIGHLDTVFEGEGEKFVRYDTLAAGAGSSDMKGGDLVILYALKALKHAGVLDDTRIIVALTGDEEDAGPLYDVSRKPLVEAAKRSDIALGFEEDAGRGTVARRGMGGWQLVVTGRQAHSSGIFSQGSSFGAIYEAARILNEFREKLSGEQYLTFNPGVAVGGTAVTLDSTGTVGTAAGKDNVVAEHMRVTGDLRTISPEQFERAEKTMREIVAASLPGTHSEITFETGYPPMAPTEGNRKLLAIYDQASRDVGSGGVVAVDPAKAGAADISFVANLVPMSIDALGLSGHDDHTDKETADLRTLPMKTKRTAVFLLRLSNGAVKMTTTPSATR